MRTMVNNINVMQVKGLLWFLLFTAFLSSCQNNRSSSKQVFHYNESSNIASLDPAFAKKPIYYLGRSPDL